MERSTIAVLAGVLCLVQGCALSTVYSDGQDAGRGLEDASPVEDACLVDSDCVLVCRAACGCVEVWSRERLSEVEEACRTGGCFDGQPRELGSTPCERYTPDVEGLCQLPCPVVTRAVCVDGVCEPG